MSKLILALHGIGDQTRNETILATAARFRAVYGGREALALGEFHRVLEGGRPPRKLLSMGFAEIYWADIPRRVVTEGYTLQETKAWARAVIEQLREAADTMPLVGSARLKGVDYDHVKDVVEEMVTTITVLEALLFVAKKAGVLDFNLRRLLDDYIGDVQLVVDFADLRDDVMKRFRAMLENAHKYDPKAEIYLVTHSEGTVVALLCLLEAASSVAPPPWLERVKGFMTLGSPISKHLVLWPELFERFTGPNDKSAKLAIPWMNYYDYGDPVGFDLYIARDWLRENHYDGVFAFPETNDFGFARYYLPGKAHSDYWHDNRVFGHFIVNVVKPPDTVPHADRLRTKPGSILAARIFCYVFPYGVFLLVVGASVYLLYRGIGMAINLPGSPSSQIPENVSAIGALLAGITASLRICHLTKRILWKAVAALILAVSICIYAYLAQWSPELAWIAALSNKVGVTGARFGAAFVILATVVFGACLGAVDKFLNGITGRHRFFRFFGEIIFVAAIALLVTALVNLNPEVYHNTAGRIWPALLSGAAFLYLWWLAALLFDMTFVWHRYIRSSLVVNLLRKTPEAHQAAMMRDIPRSPVRPDPPSSAPR